MTLRPLVAVMVLAAAPLRAQTSDRLPGRIEVAGGATWAGGVSFGSQDATETTATGGTYRLFSSSTDLAAAVGVDARVAFRVRPTIELELHGGYAAPELRTQITFDVEPSNAPTIVRGAVRRFDIGADAIWYPPVARLGGRTRVFVAGGAAYVRQLEGDGTSILTGAAYDAGGGLKVLLRSRPVGSWKAIGVRVDARAIVRSGGTAVDARAHATPSVGASLFVRF